MPTHPCHSQGGPGNNADNQENPNVPRWWHGSGLPTRQGARANDRSCALEASRSLGEGLRPRRATPAALLSSHLLAPHQTEAPLAAWPAAHGRPCRIVFFLARQRGQRRSPRPEARPSGLPSRRPSLVGRTVPTWHAGQVPPRRESCRVPRRRTRARRAAQHLSGPETHEEQTWQPQPQRQPHWIARSRTRTAAAAATPRPAESRSLADQAITAIRTLAMDAPSRPPTPDIPAHPSPWPPWPTPSGQHCLSLRPRRSDLAQPRSLRPVHGACVHAPLLDAASDRRQGRGPRLRKAR